MAVIKHYISLDEQKFQSKPDNITTGTISQNLGSAESDVEVSARELVEYLVQPNGQSWAPATFSNNSRTVDCWQSQGFIALDFDYEDPNHSDPKKAEKYKKDIDNKKEFFGPNYKPGIKIEDVISRCEKYGVMPCAAHTSFSSDETNNRFRVIFQLYDTNTNPKIAKYLQYALYTLFPESDKSCAVDIARLFFGGINEIYSEYSNVLDIYALFKGSLDYVTEVYNPKCEQIKDDLNSSTLISRINVLSFDDYTALSDKSDVVETADADGKHHLVQFSFGERVNDNGKEKVASFGYKREESKTVMDDWDTKWISEALVFCDAADREVWVNIGMGLKHSFGDLAMEMWKSWSRTAPNAERS